MTHFADRSATRHLASFAAAAALFAGCTAGTAATTAKGGGALVATLHPVNPATGEVDTRIDLGTVRFTQGNGKVDVLAQLQGVSIAGQEPRGIAGDGQGVYYPHGIHVHEGSSCGPTTVDGKTVPAGAAGPHFDPAKTNSHKGPTGDGHAGDLPNVQVVSDGSGMLMSSTTRFTLDQIKGRTVILHANPDNYTDTPPNGGSGARIACGVIVAE